MVHPGVYPQASGYGTWQPGYYPPPPQHQLSAHYPHLAYPMPGAGPSGLIPQAGLSAEPCAIGVWCQRFGLGEEERVGLKKLGFRVGDKVSSLADNLWKEVGLLPLEWGHIIEADQVYRAEIATRGD
jgi:hypothetical protein